MTRYSKTTFLAATALALAACSGANESGEVTVEDAAEITATEVKTEAVLSAERTREGLNEQGKRLVGEAQEKAAALEDVGETIKTKTELNAERLKSDGAIDTESAEKMKAAADEKAAALKSTGDEIVNDAKDKAKAMKDTGEKMVEEVKDAKPE